MKNILIGAALALFLSLTVGCGWPIKSEDMPAVVNGLSADNASGCFWLGGRGGAGAMPLAGAAVPVGGYGSGEILLGRVNSPNTTLKIENGTCTVERGPATEAAGVP